MMKITTEATVIKSYINLICAILEMDRERAA